MLRQMLKFLQDLCMIEPWYAYKRYAYKTACTFLAGNLFAILEYCSNGNLRDYLRSKRPTEENKEIGLDRSEILRIYSQVSDGLSFLASKNVRKDFMFIVDTSKIILS